MPKAKSQKKGEKDNINYKKLFFELMFVLSAIFIVVIVLLYPVLKEHGAFNKEAEEYAVFSEILDKADHYDKNNGRDLEFEKQLSDGYSVKDNASKIFYYGLASAVYYCEIGYYNTSDSIFNYLYSVVPNGKTARMDLETRDVICQRKMEKNDV